MLLVLSCVLVLFFGLSGLALDRAYRNSVEAGAAERLQVQVYLLLAALEQEGGEFFVIETIQEPRYALLNSGLYGFVQDARDVELWRSDSARALNLSETAGEASAPGVGESRFETVEDASGAALFQFRYGILWEGEATPYVVSVLELGAPYFAQIRDFRRSLGQWLGGAAVLLLLALVALLGWGLRPLSQLSRQLQRIEAGTAERLDGDYPAELAGLTTNLNRLIESERRQRERYRTTLADLAHSLKTPLSVATGALRELADSQAPQRQARLPERVEEINAALNRMDQIVAYQLQRAVASRRESSLAARVEISDAIQNLLAALSKVYAERAIVVTTRLEAGLVFRGDERDLLEVLGNVLDNAFKYSHTAVLITTRRLSRSAIEIVVDDDGPGIPLSKRAFVLQRGARADTLAKGQGIGLAVVSDIVASYDGEVQIAESELGGARFSLRFTQAVSEL